MDHFSVTLSILVLVTISFALYRFIFKKKTSQPTTYTPYDDFTRGTNDTNSHMTLEEDTVHTIRFEVVAKDTDEK